MLELTTGYRSLGGPPNFTTITRDTYPLEERFSASFIVNAARGIAAAGQYIHSKQVMHGDMYAHNILVDAKGHAKLGDFGAGRCALRCISALYRPKTHSRAHAICVIICTCHTNALAQSHACVFVRVSLWR